MDAIGDDSIESASESTHAKEDSTPGGQFVSLVPNRKVERAGLDESLPDSDSDAETGDSLIGLCDADSGQDKRKDQYLETKGFVGWSSVLHSVERAPKHERQPELNGWADESQTQIARQLENDIPDVED